MAYNFPLRKDRNTVWIYGDESSQNAHDFCVFGTLIGSRVYFESEKELRQVREQFRLLNEMKWTKAPSRREKFFEGYKAVIEYFSKSEFRFKALVIDAKLYPMRHKVYTDNKRDLGYYKYFYQLLYNGIMKRNKDVNYNVYLDPKPKEEAGSVETLEACLNGRAVIDNFPDIHGHSLCVVEEFDEDSACMQLADLLTGMIAARWNQRVTSPVKLELIDYAEKTIGVNFAGGSSPYKNTKLNIWTFNDTKWEKK